MLDRVTPLRRCNLQNGFSTAEELAHESHFGQSGEYSGEISEKFFSRKLVGKLPARSDEFRVRRFIPLAIVFLAAALGCAAQTPDANWTGNYSPCNQHAELASRKHISFGVKIATSNPVLAQEFARAMDFWTGVLDADWHQVDSQDCAIEVVDGTPELFDVAGGCACVVARSQLPDRAGFEGWIAFNPRAKLSAYEMFMTAVHEIGHLLGLPHNPNEASVMYFFSYENSAVLDAADLASLAAGHNLRPGVAEKGGVTVDTAPDTRIAFGVQKPGKSRIRP